MNTSSLSLSNSSSSVDVALDVINTSSNAASVSSAAVDRIIGGYAGSIALVKTNLTNLGNQIAQAQPTAADPTDGAGDDERAQFVAKYLSTLELTYTDRMNADLSDDRILRRFEQLDDVFGARVSAGVAIKVETNAKAERDKINEQAKDLRIEDDEGAASALARLQELIKSEGQRAIDAVGNLEQKKVDALLGDPKVDATKLDRYKKKTTTKQEEEAAAAEAGLPPVSTVSPVQTEEVKQDKALERRNRNNTIDSVG